MAQADVRRLVVLMSLAVLSGCASVPFQVDATADKTDPILVTPDARGVPGGPIWISLPEFALESGRSLLLSVDLPRAGTSTVTLEMTVFGGIEAQIPRLAYDALARTLDPADAIFKALGPHVGKLRVRQGPNTLAAQGLAVTLAARLPRSSSRTWNDLYAHDSELRSLALVPGMRLRLEGVTPVTADTLKNATESGSQGSIAAASYLYLSPADEGTNGATTFSPALRGLNMNGSRPCGTKECQLWQSAVGLSSLAATQWHHWTVLYPEQLGAVNLSTGSLQFVQEQLTEKPGVPAVLLVATSTVEAMSAFIDDAKKKLSQKSQTVAIDCRDTTDARCFVLRYRVLPIPEILVTVQGVQRWVEVGTTVGMALAPHEPVRAPRTLDGKYSSEVEAWRNEGTRLDSRRWKVHRLYRGNRHAIEVQAGSPYDAVRNLVLQPGDEIKWSN